MRQGLKLHHPVRTAAMAGLLLALAAGFIALGIWQLERRAWKLDLIDRVDARIHAAPSPAPRYAPGEAPERSAAEYVRVEANGRWLAGEALSQAVTEFGSGYWVMSPFRTDDDRIVLVNRGFVPLDQRGAARTVPEGPSTVDGLLRLTEPGGGFLRSNDPAAGRWYSRDVGAIADALDLPADEVEPYFIDAAADANGGVGAGAPVGGLTVVAFRNSHLIYALTWFALSLMAIGGLVLVIRASLAPAAGEKAEA